MFIKVNKSKDRQYVQIVHSYRDEGKPKHKVIANLGYFEQLKDNPILIALGERFLKLAQKEVTPSISEMKIEEMGRYCYGHHIYRKLWEKLDLSALCIEMLRKTRIKFDFENTLYFLLIERLLRPLSKRGSFLRQDRYLGIDPIKSLQHQYRLLEVLAENKERIERFLYEKQMDLFHMKVDVVFYDITTFHFESIRDDELRDYGFSKEGKFNEVQVMLGLLVNGEGRPIGYDLFRGNTFEGNTLRRALEKLSKRFKLGRLIFVADRGLNSNANLDLIASMGYEYIVATPLRRKSKAVQQNILAQDGFEQRLSKETGEITFKHKWLENESSYKVEDPEEPGQKITRVLKDRLLVSWSSTRAERDYKKRERHIKKAKDLLEKGASTAKAKKGARRYLQTEGKQKVLGIDQQKIDDDQNWDGFHGIQTNAKLSAEGVWEAYGQLWKIEDAFRTLKSTMHTRPIFHWSPKRIEGHFALCFLAFLLERNLEIKLKNNQLPLSPQRIKELINTIEVSEIKIEDQSFYLKSNLSKEAAKILKAFRIKQPNNLTPMQQWHLK